MKDWEMIPQTNSIHKLEGVAILISDKIDPKTTKIIKNKDGNFIKGTLHQENITLLNIYGPNQNAVKYIKQILTEL